MNVQRNPKQIFPTRQWKMNRRVYRLGNLPYQRGIVGELCKKCKKSGEILQDMYRLEAPRLIR